MRMARQSKSDRRALWLAAIPMSLLALSCLYPIYFAFNNALKDNRGYIIDRFGMVSDPTLTNFVAAWTRARFGEYFMNSATVTVGSGHRAFGHFIARGFRVRCVAVPLPKTCVCGYPRLFDDPGAGRVGTVLQNNPGAGSLEYA